MRHPLPVVGPFLLLEPEPPGWFDQLARGADCYMLMNAGDVPPPEAQYIAALPGGTVGIPVVVEHHRRDGRVAVHVVATGARDELMQPAPTLH